MPFSLRRDGDTLVVAIEGVLAVENRLQFKELVMEEVARGGRHFVVDFSGVSGLDSPGLGALVSVGRAVKERGGDVRISNMNTDLRTLFALTKLDLLFPIDGGGGEGMAGQPARVAPPPAPLEGRYSEPRPDTPDDSSAGEQRPG